MLTHKLKDLELEKKTIKSRIDQLEQDLYKANRDKNDAIKARDLLESELKTAKKAKEDMDKEYKEFKEKNASLQKDLDGKIIRLLNNGVIQSLISNANHYSQSQIHCKGSPNFLKKHLIV